MKNKIYLLSISIFTLFSCYSNDPIQIDNNSIILPKKIISIGEGYSEISYFYNGSKLNEIVETKENKSVILFLNRFSVKL